MFLDRTSSRLWPLTAAIGIFMCLMLSSLPSQAQVVACFDASPPSVCVGGIVTFNATCSAGTGATPDYLWTIDGGSTVSGQVITRTFQTSGTKQIQLIAINTVTQERDTTVQSVVVHPLPVPQFTVSPAQGCAPLSVTLAHQNPPNRAPIAHYLWDLGGGTVYQGASLDTLHHPYGAGSFEVYLQVTDTNGCVSDTNLLDVVVVSAPPTVSLSFTRPSNCVLPYAVEFEANVSGAGPFTYDWDFADGTTLTNTSNAVTHGYLSGGSYPVTVTVTDNNGCTRTQGLASPLTILFPTASFGLLDTQVCVNELLTLDNQSTAANEYDWFFGTGNVLTDFEPDFAYAQAGLYTITLVATNSNTTCDDTTTRQVEVVSGPEANFSGSNLSSCQAPHTATFDNLNVSPGVNYQWNFGDGSVLNSNAPFVDHAYLQPGTYTVTLVAANPATGCTDTLRRPNYVRIVPPNAAFAAGPLAGCAPLPVTFTDLSTSPLDPITNRLWDFDGLGNASGPQANFTFPAGQHVITLTVTTVGGCVDTAQLLVQAGSPPNLAFMPADSTICAVTAADFINQSSNVNAFTEWEWLFGDGGGSDAANPQHVYQDTGFFDVTLIGSNFGCHDTLVQPDVIRVLPPVAAFAINPAQGCSAPLTVSFTDASIAADTWQWNFGDGGTSTLQNPTHVYQNAGTYVISLTVTDTVNGCTDVEVGNLEIFNPVANFTAISTNACAGTGTVTFTNTSQNATSYLWDFGDGDTSTAVNPSHQYAAPGNYPVTLIVTGANGCQDTIVRSNVAQIGGPVVDFEADNLVGCVPFDVQFTNLSSSAAGISTVVWDFGDSSATSNQLSPSHQYQSGGSYDVTLIVVDSAGCVDILTQPAYIRPTQPEAFFTTEKTQACAQELVAFEDESTPSSQIVAWQWDFGDGNGATVPNPTHAYTANGVYTISLTVTDGNGCTDTHTEFNLVNISPPTPEFTTLSPVTGSCPPLVVDFQDQSTGPISQWIWDFGDGSPASNDTNPSRVYSAPGIYDVTLVVVSPAGCRDTVVKPGLINLSGPSGSLAVDRSSGCSPLTVIYTVIARNTDNLVLDLGDGQGLTSPVNQSPDTLQFTHTYTADGNFDPVLTLQAGATCSRNIGLNGGITIDPGPRANFRQVDTLCPGDTLVFVDSSSNLSSTDPRIWDFGDGTVAFGNNVFHAYDQPGVYQVRLAVERSNGCQDTIIKPVLVATPPTAAFVPTPDSVCPDLPIDFNNTSAPGTFPLDTWSWRFETGQTSTLAAPSYTYASPGTPTVRLIATDERGCRDTAQRTVLVHNRPVANFSAIDTAGCAPRLVSFSDHSQNAASYFWDFGDGDTSILVNPQHTYLQDGAFDVQLVVTSPFGCRDTADKPNLVVLSRPEAAFASNVVPGCPPLPVLFDAAASTADTSIVAYQWDFGLGNGYTPPSSSSDTAFTYQQPGSYTVSLIVEDAFQCRDTLVDTQHVEVYTPPVASFTVSEDTFCAPQLVTVSSSSTPGSSPFQSFAWDFANGSSSGGASASVLYQHGPAQTSDTVYTISLTVTDANGCTDVAQRSVLVHPEAQADFSADTTITCKDVIIPFTDLSDSLPPVISWDWDFGDGNTSTLSNPTHAYDTVGSYTVTLRIEDQNGCQATVSKPGLIDLDGPLVAFTPTNAVECPGVSIQFTDLSTGPDPIVGWLWEFGNGDIAMSQDPLYAYPDSGVYDVTLTVTDARGCTHTRTQPSAVVIRARPEAVILPDSIEGCAPLRVNFSANGSSSLNGNISATQWTFSTGGSSTVPNPVRTFAAPGTHTVWLRVTDALGCTDSTLHTLTVRDTPVANFTPSATYVCSLQQITFINQTLGIGNDPAYWWDFGDGNTLDSVATANPTHGYSTNGLYDVQLVVENEQGCRDTLVRPQLIEIAPPQVAFTVDDSTGCPGTTLTFDDLSVSGSPIVSQSWDFGNGSTGSGASASHVYASSGLYDITLTVTDSLGCSASLTHSELVEIYVPPTAAMFPADTAGCMPFSLTFTDVSQYAPGTGFQSRLWTFDNGTNANAAQANTTYSTPGNYLPRLMVTDLNGCSDIAEGQVEVFGLPNAQFSVPAAAGCVGVQVPFTNLSTPFNPSAPVVNYIWDLGNGSTSNDFEPNPTYDSAGVFPIQLLVIDANGCRDSAANGSVIQIWQPEADFAISGPICPGESITFTDGTTADTTLDTWLWVFGNGDSTLVANQPGHNVSATYGTPGFYPVTLQVQDVNGCRDTLVQDVEVFEPPQAAMTLDPRAGCAPLDVQASDQSTGPAPISTWRWARNGQVLGNTSSYQFQALSPGWQYLSLQVEDANGCQDVLTDSVEVFSPPVIDFWAEAGSERDTIFCPDETITFNGTASPSGIDWQWQFGDGQGSRANNPLHAYAQPGRYDVRLTVTDANGCVDSLRKVRYISVDTPLVNFSVQGLGDCPPVDATFLGTASGRYAPFDFTWDFGDFTTGQGRDPAEHRIAHTYQDTGQMVVVLTVTDTQGCQAETTQPLAIEGSNVPGPVDLLAASVIGDDQVELTWAASNEADFEAYRIYWQNDFGNWEPVDGWNGTSYQHGGIDAAARPQCYALTQVNGCGNEGPLNAAERHCTVEIEAQVDSNEVILTWAHYRGWTRIDRYDIYRVQSYGDPGELVGSVPGNTNRWRDASTACSGTYTYRVEAVGEVGGERAFSDLDGVQFEPRVPTQSTHLIRATVEDDAYVLVEWTAWPLRHLETATIVRENPRNGTLLPLAELSPGVLSYRDTTAQVDVQPYTYYLSAADSCGFTTPLTNPGTSIHLEVSRSGPVNQLSWTPYRGWDRVRGYKVQLLERGGWEDLPGQIGPSTTSLEHAVQAGPQVGRQYCYRVIAYEDGGNNAQSVSNIACTEINEAVVVPNVFTPNGDGINDRFFVAAHEVETLELTIYNRWGKQVALINGLGEPFGWDGLMPNGTPAQEGVYAYRFKAQTLTGMEVSGSGTLTLVR